LLPKPSFYHLSALGAETVKTPIGNRPPAPQSQGKRIEIAADRQSAKDARSIAPRAVVTAQQHFYVGGEAPIRDM
jgi:hypothetical protein